MHCPFTIASFGLKNRELAWAIPGAKRILSGIISRDDCKGRLELNGVYRTRENKIYGANKIHFIKLVGLLVCQEGCMQSVV
ncbi:MAG: hypothetical protein A3G93_08370 [Nitrospinae bacterium RIFCSPLOWO2_12_FULL_45_22]|nr:MAG: hypothetical protein A3G93_08370 [Nitrospinae bacterium RIFCSPLOWO2_12_FULL_45_22]